MLELDPSSTCCVCEEPFAGEAAQKPCALRCGHIFCKKCIMSLTRSVCPFCRRIFLMSETTDLFIERSTDPSTQSQSSSPDTTSLLQSLRNAIRDEPGEYSDNGVGEPLQAVHQRMLSYLSPADVPHESSNNNFLQTTSKLLSMLISADSKVQALKLNVSVMESMLCEAQLEKATAQVLRNSLQSHYDEENLRWTRKYDGLSMENHALQEQVLALQAEVKKYEQSFSETERQNQLIHPGSMSMLNEAYETEFSDSVSNSGKDRKWMTTSSRPQPQSAADATPQAQSSTPPPKLIRKLSSFPFAPPLPPKTQTESLSRSGVSTQGQARAQINPNQSCVQNLIHAQISTHSVFDAQTPVVSTTSASEFKSWLTQRWSDPALPAYIIGYGLMA